MRHSATGEPEHFPIELESATVRSGERDWTLQSSVPTLCVAAGMLAGGILSAWSGALTGSDRLTAILAAIGMVGGSLSGGYLGTRWHRRQTDRPAGSETDSDSDRSTR